MAPQRPSICISIIRLGSALAKGGLGHQGGNALHSRVLKGSFIRIFIDGRFCPWQSRSPRDRPKPKEKPDEDSKACSAIFGVFARFGNDGGRQFERYGL